ncbi:MAG: heme exporter protein CcmB [Alphaproteobacteria bacterium CG11_big_fil_rev_8_21_14_0_20_39_49]|nr:MAG: heme exporter protein CcmB [Alphaproteobacteria bacterium CG11_big_fil_rev_8_21_14_0_20_39_49]
MNIMLILIKRDLLLAAKKGSGTGNIIAFFIISSILFAFGTGSEPDKLKSIGTGTIWVCALLSSMMAIPKIFDEDYEDGSLAQIFLQGHLTEIVILSKIISHWIISCLPLILITPFIAMLFNIENNTSSIMLSLAIGTPILCSIGIMGAALTLGVKRAGNLIGIIILPLYIPTMIFGVSANIKMLLSVLLLMLPIAILATGTAIKEALGE